LLVYLDRLDLILPITVENTIVNKRVLLTALRIVDRDDQGVVLADVLGETECHQIVQVKLDLGRVDVLSHSRLETHFLYVVGLIGREEHHRHIIGVLLLGDASVDTDDTFDQSVKFERNAEEGTSFGFVDDLRIKINWMNKSLLT